MSFQKVADALDELQTKVSIMELENMRLVKRNEELQADLTMCNLYRNVDASLIARLRTENTMVQDA